MHLYDAYGRKINYLRISLTDRCNLQCFYCRKDNITFYGRDEILSLEEIEFLISAFYHNFGVKKIRFTGGEPLLRRGVEKLIEGLKDLNLSLNITTNGILLGEFAEFLSKNNVSVNVSLDTLSPEKFKRIAGSYDLERIIDGVDKSIELGIKLKINTVLLRGVNDSEIFDLIDFAFSRGIEIRFIEFMPFVDELVWRTYFISEDEIRNKIEEKYKLFKVEDGDSVARYYVLENGAKIGFISTVSKPFCHTCSRVRITSDGGLVLCMFDKFSYPLKRFLRPEPREEELVRFVSSIAELKPKGFIELKEKQASFQMIRLGG
ncbi:MAG: GTP 3',8-cyclase MoaA [Candidatus Kryptonium sp.]